MESGSAFVKEESEEEVEEIYNFSVPSVCYKSDPLARYIYWLVRVLGIDQNFDLFYLVLDPDWLVPDPVFLVNLDLDSDVSRFRFLITKNKKKLQAIKNSNFLKQKMLCFSS